MMIEFFCEQKKIFYIAWICIFIVRIWLNRELLRWNGDAYFQDIRDTTTSGFERVLPLIFNFKWFAEDDDNQKILNYKKTANILGLIFIIYSIFMLIKWLWLFGRC